MAWNLGSEYADFISGGSTEERLVKTYHTLSFIIIDRNNACFCLAMLTETRQKIVDGQT